MPNKKHIPAYRLHKPSGQARVIIDGKHIYLGPYGSPESREKYARLIAERFGKHGKPSENDGRNGHSTDLTVNDVLLMYWRFAETYYVSDGAPTKELEGMRDALRPVRQLYGHTAAVEFGPKALKTVREHMIEMQGLARTEINKRIGRIKRAFKWAVSEEWLPSSVAEGLRTVAGLEYGRTEARETEPVPPAPEAAVEAVLPYVAPQVAAMIRLQRLTGMRPGEVVLMRPRDLEMTGDVWIYEPYHHKNRWRGHRKLIPLGPKAQEVVEPFLDREADAYMFSPREAEAWRQAHRPVHYKKNRKTPVYPSELRQREKAKQARRKRTPKRPKREHYDRDSYRKAIEYGFQKARKAGVDIEHWHPNQLRHSRGTEVRKQYGIEAAQVLLGHARADVTQVYAEKNLRLAMQIAHETG